jgi:hypothetical protein
VSLKTRQRSLSVNNASWKDEREPPVPAGSTCFPRRLAGAPPLAVNGAFIQCAATPSIEAYAAMMAGLVGSDAGF